MSPQLDDKKKISTCLKLQHSLYFQEKIFFNFFFFFFRKNALLATRGACI